MIQSLHHAQMTLPAHQETLARQFYGEFLGLKELPKPENLKDRGGLWFALGAVQVHLGVQEGVDRLNSKTHLAFQVTDIQDWRQRLMARGHEVLEGLPIPGYARFEFRDPFGNRLEFMEPELK